MKTTLLFTLGLLASAALHAAPFQQELAAAPGETLSVELRSGSVEIAGWNRNAIRVEAELPGRLAPALEVRRTARGVVVTDGEGRRGGAGLVVRIQVPSSYDARVETLGGSIAVDGVSGSLHGKTLGGELRLARLRGTVEMTTHGGNVTLRDSSVEGNVRTMGGEVLLENVSGGVKGSSMGGNVIYRNVRRPDGSSTGKSVEMTTMGGAINVEQAPHGATLSTMGGNIRVAAAREFVKAKTMGGSIEIDGVDGWIEARTMGGNVRAIMVGNPASGDRHVVIDSKGGEIELTLPAGLEAEFDIEIAFTRNSRRNYEIRSEFPLQIATSPEWDYAHGSPRRTIEARGRTGSGKNRVTIRTINGNVVLKRGR